MTIDLIPGDNRRPFYTADSDIADMFLAAGGATWMCWHNTRTIGFGGFRRLMYKNDVRFSIGEFATNDFRSQLFIQASGGNGNWNSGVAFPIAINTWYHFAVSWEDGDTSPTLWINGVDQGVAVISLPGGAQFSDSTDPLHLGNSSGGTQSLDGPAVDFRVYAGKLSDARVMNIANARGRDRDVIGLRRRCYAGPYLEGATVTSPVPDYSVAKSDAAITPTGSPFLTGTAGITTFR